MSIGLANLHIAAAIETWMRCESPTSVPKSVAAMAQLVSSQAEAFSLSVQTIPTSAKVGPMLHISTRQTGDDRVGALILGHLDTVHPIGTLERNPIRSQGDRLYGPGGYNMKAGFELEDAPMTGGGSDGNFVAALGVPVLDGLGADGDGAHTLDEYILISTLSTRLAFWKELLKYPLIP